MDNGLSKLRRNIHTYPFKYRHIPAQEFFGLEAGVIYIHIPFCSTKCHFCDYTVYTHKSDDLKEQYVRALCREIAAFTRVGAFPRFRIEAIYFGGGTPGTLTGEQLVRIYRTCRDNFDLADDCEVCAEFDPASVEEAKLQEVREGGFNRLSVGVQSFDDALLKQSNRPHNAEAIYRAFDLIEGAGFTHTNVDLIYPLPGLTHEIWQDTVRRALALKTSCVTVYGLEIWPGTAYFNWLEKGKLSLPSGQVEVEMYEYAIGRLEEEGFRPRSNSGYYHPDRFPRYCRFLDFYWRTWPMIGFGVSSKSVVHNRLWTNVKPLREYIDRADRDESSIDFATYLTRPQEMRRVMIRGLKMCEVEKAEFYERFGVEMESIFRTEIEALVDKGLLTNEADRVALTRHGRTYGTNVYEQFYTRDDLSPPTSGEIQFGISQLIND